MKFFVGYDSRYQTDYYNCSKSLGVEVKPTPNELITRPQDGSTQFTYSRFLIPHVCSFKGWAFFCDSDFIFLENVSKLTKLINNNYAVMVCKHPNYVPKTQLKMEGQNQTTYERKNWSSLILWNCSHHKNKTLNPDFINTVKGLYLHQFKWLTDEDIGSLPLEWNTLVGYYNFKNPKALHYTDGTENMKK